MAKESVAAESEKLTFTISLSTFYDVDVFEWPRTGLSTEPGCLLSICGWGCASRGKKYRDLKEKVSRAVSAYGSVETLTYLRAIAHLSHV